MIRLKYILSALFIVVCCNAALYGQEIQSGSILMRGETHKDKTLIRWAPTDAKTWQLLNKYGVQLEKITVVRNGAVLDEPEEVVLYDTLRPMESPQFRLVAETYPYAAIIAQAVFGDSFVVSGTGSQDISTIIALSDELQQRYVLSLYASDLCFPGALAAGWGWEDKEVRENDRYLYRVVPLVPQEEMEITPGVLFVDASRLDRFPVPLDFDGQFMDGSVMLSWNYRSQEAIYNAYIPERSTDGVNFTPITDTPVTRMEDSRSGQILYADSIQNGVKYYYRLAGVTPFGSRSEYSNVISGTGVAELRNPPFITKAIPDKNGGVDIEWTFDEADEELIESFTLERSDDDKKYSDYVPRIDRKRRSVNVPGIPSTNYFVIAANSNSGKRVRSFPAFVQAVDTLPPPVPVGLAGIADTTGAVRLSWLAAKDDDTFGYRLFRSHTPDAEMFPLNDNAIRDTVFVDTVDPRSLNNKIYYAIASLDARYNQSDKSPVLEVLKPETVPPTPPVIREIKVENGCNVVRWVSGQESNLAGYDLYRKAGGEEEFVLLAALGNPQKCAYEDADVENNRPYIYHVMSRSEGGLLSEPSPDYKVTAISKSNTKYRIVLNLVPQKDAIRLNWKIPVTNATSIQLYKKAGGGTLSLYSEGLEATGETEDKNVVPGVKYEYMLVVKSNDSAPQSIVKSILL